MSLSIWTGFHWCSPVNPSNSDRAKTLLQSAGRWGAVVLLYPCDNCTNSDFTDACNKIMDARQAVGGGRSLDQTIVRLYHSEKPSFTTFAEADAWVRRWYIRSLDYFVTNAGRNVVVFNELGVTSEPQFDIDPRTLGLISQALRNAYWNGGNRLLYTLFPGPGALQPLEGSNCAWNTCFEPYFHKYDLHDATHSPRTFNQVYGSVDGMLYGKTMLWHGGNGVFDRVALHCYEDTPSRFSDSNANNNRALQYLAWLRDRIDASGWVYVTESNGINRCSNPPSCNCGNDSTAGSSLADFEYNANAQFRNQWPYFLQAVYGYILENSDCLAKSNGWHSIDSNYINGYNTRRIQLGF